MRNSLIGFGAVVVLFVGAMFAWPHLFPKPTDSVVQVTDFDAFQRLLANQVRTRFQADESSVVVAPTEYDLGTLLEPTHTTPSNDSDCVPKPSPKARAAENLFPAYQLTSKTAASMTLGSDALQRLTEASLNLAHTSSLVYSIDQVNVLMMDMKSVDQATLRGACGDWVRSHPGLRMIRGIVTGKISFKLQVANPTSMEAKLPKLAGVTASSDNGSSTITVGDDAPTQILDFIAIVQAPVEVAAAPPPKPVSVPAPSPMPSPTPPPAGPVPQKPSATSPQHDDEASLKAAPAAALQPAGGWVAHIYLQQDAAQAPDTGSHAAAALAANWPKALVEQKVERIPSAKMPGSAQVRFFNASDADLAATCRDRLKTATGIDARVVRVGLGAPAKQLEVWLPKAGS